MKQLTGLRDEVDAMGFKVDGYNYSKHFRAGGGGVVVNADGSIADDSQSAVIPEELLATPDVTDAFEGISLLPG